MSKESMAHKVIRKVNARIKFLHRKIKYLTPKSVLLTLQRFNTVSF